MSRNSTDWHGKAISEQRNLLDAWRGGARVLESAHHVRPVANDAVRVRPPRLYCPFPAAIHAEADRIEEGTIAWMKSFCYINDAGAERTARSAQFGIRAARVHPTGDIEAIQLVSDLTVWLFLTDDVHVEKPGIARSPAITVDHLIRSMRVLRNPDDLSPRTSASLLALQDISRRMCMLATDEQRHRLISGMQEFFFAGCCEAITRSRRSLPSVADYVSVRDAINCLRSVCFVFIEIVGGFELPGSTWCRTDLQDIVNRATRIVSNHHDILSGLRELSDEVPMNLPAVLAQEQGLPIAEAFARVGAIADADTHAFVTLCNRLLRNEPDPSVKKYVDGLKDWIRGNLDWSRTTGRYRVQQYESAGADLPLD